MREKLELRADARVPIPCHLSGDKRLRERLLKLDGRTMARKPTKKTEVKADSEKSKYGAYAGFDVLIVNGSIEEALFAKVMRCVGANKKSDKLVLVLVTYGGQANPAYRIGRLLQGMYEEIVVFIPSYCKSAGTLIAVAGSKVVFSFVGEIGPLDVQLLERDEIGERKSGLTMRSALDDLRAHSFELFSDFMQGIKVRSGNNVSFKLAAELAGDVTNGLMSSIYCQIHPDVLGKDFRDLSVATKYGERLDRKFGNLRQDAIYRLVHEYPSHDFVIDYDEAEEIFKHAELASEELMELMGRKQASLMSPRTTGSIVEMEHWELPESDAGATNDDSSEDGGASVAAE